MRRVRKRRARRARVQVCAPDGSLTRFSGLAAVTELTERLGVIDRLDATVGPIKARDRGFTAGQVLVGMAAAQLCGEDFLVGLDRHRTDAAGQVLTPVPGLASTTAAGLARRLTEGQWVAVETGLGDVQAAALDLLGRVDAVRAEALSAEVTIDMDTSDVEVYGRLKQGVAFNHQGQRVGRPHVATWTYRWCWPPRSSLASAPYHTCPDQAANRPDQHRTPAHPRRHSGPRPARHLTHDPNNINFPGP